MRIAGPLIVAMLAVVRPVPSAIAGPDDQAGVNQACSAEADRLGLHGPERFDFRAQCRGRGLRFQHQPMGSNCRQVIVENGISGRASERIQTLRGRQAVPELCRQRSVMRAAQTRAVSILESDPSRCGYTREQVDELRANLVRMDASDTCGTDAGGPGL